MTATHTSTSTSTAAPLTGAALIAHHEAHRDGNRTAAVLAANYRRANGRPAFTAFYEALLEANNSGGPGTIAARAADLARSHEAAAANPDAWHGHLIGQPERFALLTITDAEGEQIGATIPVPIDRTGWSTDAELQEAERLIERHANAYADAAQGPDAFPLLVTLTDRAGAVEIFEIDSDGDLSDAFSDGISRCDRCGSIHNTDDGQTVNVRNRSNWSFDPEQWCSDCADNHATRCNDCSEHYDSDETHRTGDNTQICSECVDQNCATCDDCGDLYHYDDVCTVDDSETVCRHCLDHHEGTRYHYHPEQGWSTEPPEDDDDDDDDDDEPQGPDGMRRYAYHTDANRALGHQIPNTGHTYGAELEYKDSPSDWPAVAAACHRRAILTNDSTVSGELVSVALTAGQIRRWLAATAAALTGTKNDSNTGMHCHIDRRALTPWQWFTLSHYAAKHAATLEIIAGRGPNQWSNLQSLPAADWPTFARSWHYRSWPNRYAGLNLSKGPTAEWRICRATKTPERALARFGMIQRLAALGRLAPSQRPQTAEELRGWLAQDRHIAAVTSWEPGTFNYRAALMQPRAQGDQQPTLPGPEEIAALREQIRRLDADERLTNRLAGNALARYRSSTEGPDAPYTRDSWAQYLHHQRWADALNQRISQARRALQETEALQTLQSLNP